MRLSAAEFIFFTPVMSGTALPNAKQQKSYTKDSTDYINFIKKKFPANATLLLDSMNGNDPLYKQYAEHTERSTLTNLPSQHHSLSKYMAQPWAQGWK